MNGDGDENGEGNKDGIGEGGEEAEKRKKPYKVVDASRHFRSACAIISADRG